jgi:hypothetical protein
VLKIHSKTRLLHKLYNSRLCIILPVPRPNIKETPNSCIESI